MKKLLGTSPATTLVGLLISALMIYQELTAAGEVSKKKIAIAILIGVLGRLVKDSNGITAGKENRLMNNVMPDKSKEQ